MNSVERPAETPVEGSASIKEYTRLKDDLLRSIGRMSGMKHLDGESFAELNEKLTANVFNLVVVGQFKRGKTCLIDALMGSEILPVAVVPLTSIVTVLKFGEEVSATVFYEDGRREEIDPARIDEYVTESGNPKNIKKIHEVVITYPSDYLRDGVRLIDTPGVGSVYQHNTDVAYRYLPKSDAALFLLSVDQPLGQAEIDFLTDVRQYADRIFFLLNKIDYLTDGEIEESLRFSRTTLRDLMGSDVKIFPISARQALDGKLGGSTELLQKSRLPIFSAALDQFLLHEKGRVLLVSVANSLLRILAQGSLELGIEIKSLTAPLDELNEKIRTFEAKKEKIVRERGDLGLLLEGEVNRLIREVLDEDIRSFKRELAPRLQERLDWLHGEKKDLPLKELNQALETLVIEEVQTAFSAFHAAEEEKIIEEFRSICSRFSSDINDAVDELMQFSSELFSVPMEAGSQGGPRVIESSFSFKILEEPVGLDMLSTSLAENLPGLVHGRFQKLKAYLARWANRVIYNKRKQQMIEAIEMQAGRLRSDYLQRLHRSKSTFLKDSLQRIEAAAEGLSRAIGSGMEMRRKGEQEAEARRLAILRELSELEAIRDEIAGIKGRAEAS